MGSPIPDRAPTGGLPPGANEGPKGHASTRSFSRPPSREVSDRNTRRMSPDARLLAGLRAQERGTVRSAYSPLPSRRAARSPFRTVLIHQWNLLRLSFSLTAAGQLRIHTGFPIHREEEDKVRSPRHQRRAQHIGGRAPSSTTYWAARGLRGRFFRERLRSSHFSCGVPKTGRREGRPVMPFERDVSHRGLPSSRERPTGGGSLPCFRMMNEGAERVLCF